MRIGRVSLLEIFNFTHIWGHCLMLSALEIDYENNKVKVDLSKLYKNIDIPETLSNIKGKWIKKITPDYVEFEDGEKINLNNLDYKLIKPLIWW